MKNGNKQENKMETSKKIIAGCLIGFIIIASILVYIYRDAIFLHKMSVTYPDGCVEKFENGKLITSECNEGRILIEQQNNDNYVIDNRTDKNFTFDEWQN